MRRKGCARIKSQRIVPPGKRSMSALLDRIAHVKGTIAAACQRANRSPTEVQLIAVTKTVPTDIIAQAYTAPGCVPSGRIGSRKRNPRSASYRRISSGTSSAICNRTKRGPAAGLFDTIHSVDSVRLGQRLAARAAAGQVHTDAPPGQPDPGRLHSPALHRKKSAQPSRRWPGEAGVALDGLMTIAPQATDQRGSPSVVSSAGCPPP